MLGNSNEQLVLEAVGAFKAQTDIPAVLDPEGYLTLRNGNNKTVLKIVTAPQLVGIQIAQAMLEQKRENVVLVTNHVSDKMAEDLKKMGIPFLDKSGNAYINSGSFVVYVRGIRPIVREGRAKPVRIFKDIGIKLIFTLLSNPGIESSAYRILASEAGIALGGIGAVFDDLMKVGYLIRKGKRKFRLVNKEELLKRWVIAYSERLLPKLELCRFSAIDGFDSLKWKNLLLPEGTYWGGAMAAAKLTEDLIPADAVIYASGRVNEVALQLRLKSDNNGNIRIFKKFWNFVWDKDSQTVPPLLVYADLLATGAPRNVEAAGIVYEKILKRILA